VSWVACHILFKFLWASMGKEARALLMLRLILVIYVVWDALWSIVPLIVCQIPLFFETICFVTRILYILYIHHHCHIRKHIFIKDFTLV
jgi:uncharacterized membrane protein YhdT